jgi:hypothetical protein
MKSTTLCTSPIENHGAQAFLYDSVVSAEPYSAHGLSLAIFFYITTMYVAVLLNVNSSLFEAVLTAINAIKLNCQRLSLACTAPNILAVLKFTRWLHPYLSHSTSATTARGRCTIGFYNGVIVRDLESARFSVT